MKSRAAEEGNQRGFASIIITFVLILILSLLTVGFAELMRHEEKSALDKQLNSQAYYAAESGINQAAAAIHAGYDKAKTTCGVSGVDMTLPGSNFLQKNTVGNSGSASFPCLLINPTPPNLKFHDIDVAKSQVVEFTAVDSAGNPAIVNSLEFGWQDMNGSTTFVNNCDTFKPASGGGKWGATGLLRTEITPIGSIDRDSLINNSFTAFLCPDTAAGTSVNYGSHTGVNSGVVVDGHCNTTVASPSLSYCNSYVTGMSSLRQSTFFLNLRSIYSPTTVTIMACSNDCHSGDGLGIKGAQVLIDSTGKAQDVLRRIQVRLPVNNSYDFPASVFGNICKQLQLVPPVAPPAPPVVSITSGSCPIP